MNRIIAGVGGMLAATLLLACSSAGPYGYTRTYAPHDAEAAAVQKARPLDLVMAQRRPDEWMAKPVHFFGVVSKVDQMDGSAAVLTLSLRRLQKRNLCRSGAEDSCRVTVSEKAFGSVQVRMTLGPEDTQGADRVEPGSLLRIVGSLEMPEAGSGEAPTVAATFYRHWPAQHYVTTAARKYMRR